MTPFQKQKYLVFTELRVEIAFILVCATYELRKNKIFGNKDTPVISTCSKCCLNALIN